MYPNYPRHYMNALCAMLLMFVSACNTKGDMQADSGEIVITPPETNKDADKGILQGYQFNKKWALRVEAGASFIGLHTDTTGKTYAISNYGAVYSSSENQAWKRESVTEDYINFTAIGGYGNDIYAAGSNSALFHKKGNNGWERENIAGDSLWFTDIYVGENEVWMSAVGSDYSIWHRNKAGVWERQIVTSSPVNALYGNGTELWALSNKFIWHKKPDTKWQTVSITGENVNFSTLYQYNKHVWVMGSNGNIFYNNGGEQWKKEDTGKDTADISCGYGTMNEVYAAGKDGLILHRLPEGKWVKEDCGYEDFSATCMYGRGIDMYGRAKDIWVGGNDGFIFHRSGNGTWKEEAGPIQKNLINKFNSWGDKVFAVGSSGTLIRSPDNTWNKANLLMPDTPLTSIFKFSRDILVGGRNGMLYHRLPDGQWQLENSHAGDVVFTGLCENDKSIYLIGSKGTIVRRSKTDTTWTSQSVGAADLIKIYAYEDDIWILGNHSTILHKKENEDTWQRIKTGLSEIEFMDLYGWKGQIWALGIKNQRGIMFYKDSSNKWSKENIHNGSDHFHALYGRNDTVWAAGAFGDMSSRNKTEDDFQGMIMCKEGNSPWEKQINYTIGIHFNAINGQGDDVYALGTGGNLYHKKGNNDWVNEATEFNNESFNKLFFFRGLLMLTNNGFMYRENEDKNYIRFNYTDKLINIVAIDNDLYTANRNGIFKMTTLTEEQFPVIDNVQYTLTPFINPGSINLRFVMQRPKALKSTDQYRIEVYAKPYSDEYKWMRPVATPLDVQANHHTNSFHVSTNIEVAKSLRVIPGVESTNKICLRVDIINTDWLTQEIFILKDSDGNPYITLSNNFWLNNTGWLIPIGIVILYYIIWVLIWFFFPLLFLRIYHADILQQLISLRPDFQPFIVIINVIFPLRIMVNTRRVQNAWVKAFTDTVEERFKANEITQLRSFYVPLPVITRDGLNEKPDEKILGEIFNTKRSIIQIIGPGGSGKTSLAIEIGKWIIASTRNKKSGWVPRLPILLETDTTDLLKEITRMLRSWKNDYAIHEDFVKMLLQNQRLVIIVDSLSEKPVAIQEYFKTLHGDTPANALIITARQRVNLQAGDSTYLYPTPLNSNNLLYFITSYLNDVGNHPLQQSREQLAFAEKIVSIIEGNNNMPRVTPVLVKLIIEIALKKEGTDERDFQTVLDEMPDSIPDVYYQYLVHVNPMLQTAANYLPKQELLKIAELLGRLSLGDNFLPQDFLEEAARKEISRMYPNLPGDPVQRFIDNGILTRRESLATSYLRFNIDTLAEYLGASKLYDDNNTSPEQLSAFMVTVNSLGDGAKEFKMAFYQIRDYKMKHG